MNKNLNNTGFTLIELLVVVLIIGILASVALPRYQKAVEKARTVRMLPLMRAIDVAQQEYKLSTGEDTTDLSSLTVSLPNGGSSCDSSSSSDIKNCIKYDSFKCFVWGSGASASSIECQTLTQNSPLLEKYFDRDYFLCWANTEGSLADKICQNLSNYSSPTHGNGSRGYEFR